MKQKPNWADEVGALGMKQTLRSRLSFHRGLTVGMVAEDAGVSLQTARRHVRNLVRDGFATFTRQGEELADWHVKAV